MIVSKRVILQQQRTSGRHPVHARRQGRGLIRVVHHAEGIDHQIGRFSATHRRETPVLQQVQPRASMGTGELGDSTTARKPARCREMLHCVGSLIHQRLGLGAKRLLGHAWVHRAVARDRMSRTTTSAADIEGRDLGHHRAESGRTRAGRPGRAPGCRSAPSRLDRTRRSSRCSLERAPGPTRDPKFFIGLMPFRGSSRMESASMSCRAAVLCPNTTLSSSSNCFIEQGSPLGSTDGQRLLQLRRPTLHVKKLCRHGAHVQRRNRMGKLSETHVRHQGTVFGGISDRYRRLGEHHRCNEVVETSCDDGAERFHGLHDLAEGGNLLGDDPGVVEIRSERPYVAQNLTRGRLVGPIRIPYEQPHLASVADEPTHELFDATRGTRRRSPGPDHGRRRTPRTP